MSTISNFRTSIEANRQNWPTLVGQTNVAGLVYDAWTCENPGTLSHKLGISEVAQYRMASTDQSSDTRRPQGVAEWGGVVLFSAYYLSYFTGKCKLVAVDKATLGAQNIGLYEVAANGKLDAISSHTGGIMVDGNYVYVVDYDSIRVFDLNSCFPRSGNESAIEQNSYTDVLPYFLPEVGRIYTDRPSNAGMAYISRYNDRVVTGNYYASSGSPSWPLGGQTLVWVSDLVTDPSYEFRVPAIDATQIAIGTNANRVQGAFLLDDVLVLSRSYSSSLFSIIILKYDPTMSVVLGHFNGTNSAPQTYDGKNWLYGCQDLSLSEDGQNLITVTEFKNSRSVSYWSVADVVGLLPGPSYKVNRHPSPTVTIDNLGGNQSVESITTLDELFDIVGDEFDVC